MVAAADFLNGISSVVDPVQATYINPDLTVTVHRLPVGEWVAVDAVTVSRTWASARPRPTSTTGGRLERRPDPAARSGLTSADGSRDLPAASDRGCFSALNRAEKQFGTGRQVLRLGRPPPASGGPIAPRSPGRRPAGFTGRGPPMWSGSTAQPRRIKMNMGLNKGWQHQSLPHLVQCYIPYLHFHVLYQYELCNHQSYKFRQNHFDSSTVHFLATQNLTCFLYIPIMI